MLSVSLIQNLLSQRKDIFQWQIKEITLTSHQCFLAKKNLEALRLVNRTQFSISLFVKNEDGEGEASFSITPFTERFDHKLDMALQAARMMKNPHFDLPESGFSYPPVDILDRKTLQNPNNVLTELQDDLLQSTSSDPGIRLASGELYLDHQKVALWNSKGLHTECEHSTFHVDFVLLSGSGSDEAESLCYYKRRFLEDVQIPRQVEKFSIFALDSLHADLPQSGTFDVVFGEEALDTLFDFFTYQCSAEANYTQKAKANLGQSILGESGRTCGDLMTLYANNTLARSPGSFPFDTYGFPNGKTLLIRDHHFQTLWGSVKYAGFLGIPATGEIGTVEVNPGTHFLKELLTASGKPIYHLLRFSNFMPNRVTGHFSGEIRSGYRIDPDGSRHPVRGGAVSGNIRTAFQNVLFSKETVQREHYSGPEGIRLFNQKIGGK